MQAIAFGALRTARTHISRRSCRFVGGIRHPLPRRNFHRSTISYRIPEESRPPNPSGAEEDNAAPEQEVERKPGDEVAGVTGSQNEGDTVLARKARQGRNGSGRARINRPKQPEGLPPLPIPDWFLARNVKCFGDADLAGSLAVVGRDLNLKNDSGSEGVVKETSEVGEHELVPTDDAKYSIHADVYKEILATVKAGLALRPPRNTNRTVLRPHTVLQCPKDGTTYYLDSIVETIATKLGADLVRLDAQDLALIIGPYVDENLAWTGSTTSLLGYNAQKIAGKLEDYEKENTTQDDGEAAEEDDDGLYRPGRQSSPFSSFSSELSKRISSIISAKKPGSSGSPLHYRDRNPPDGALIGLEFVRGTGLQTAQSQPKASEEQWRELKVSTALDSLISSADLKRFTSTNTQEQEPASVQSAPHRNLIVQVKDYKDLNRTDEGPALLEALQSSINKRWLEGRNIILVGSTSSEECGLSRPDIQHLQSDITGGETRTILVPPDRREELDVAFEMDEKARIRSINIRHIEDMIVKLTDGANQPSPIVNVEKDLDNATAYSAGLEDAVWTYPRVHRIATTILGLDAGSKIIDGPVFSEAWKLLASSDEAKFGWGAAELKQEDDDVDVMIKDLNDSSKKTTKEKIKQIKQTCTVHEKRLLGGVIIPSDIHTTFEDVHSPKETVEALKTLTSLSLIRPEAFSYGVLATDKIPGLLLYGPPGTGKTLLAKAVAKESGATVLEVSGAEVNDMYVGEGEKNVKAIFTLAKKLSPCIVFIDEADAIFAQRSDMKRTGTHRELINQFLREWDGMNDLSAFIMVATNRPFDLDEAVLRRLPRRLLVDLPVEKDREAILKIHLKDEILDESVSLATLAKNTPYYSGSDLKNISVAAAFACIREENEVAAKHIGPEPYVYPEKRILTKQHFDKALDEISASISEDMSTLAAIRKFDEKYGDRKGRRKKGSGLGFGGTTVQETDSEGGRVRKVQA